jgi:DNA-binding MarR family transcriptional regulator
MSTQPAAASRKASAEPVFYRPENYAPEESVAFLMKQVLALLADAVDHELQPSGLTHAQWAPLFRIYMGHASTVAELARESQLDMGAMTRTLDRLEAKNLVRRVRSSSDRRVVNIELTPEGRATAKTIPEVLCRVQNAHLRGLTLQEWQTMKALMRRVLDTARALRSERESQKK